jgi:hypothetical protein
MNETKLLLEGSNLFLVLISKKYRINKNNFFYIHSYVCIYVERKIS